VSNATVLVLGTVIVLKLYSRTDIHVLLLVLVLRLCTCRHVIY